ncbi:MAG: hypothetical protein PWP15_1626 [Methanothermococcus sp.]|jgi:hypothetical protein|uniref:DUF2683 family protein n=1 Tax=Methanothermococcus TaxID=155862 RepID=UPI0003681341|nr:MULTISPECIES: DUF2683 family protein [Methanothermococcus]MDK2791106.1 hypothetical protein [Methanothermococcus sp.]MDK2977345.1 hypothetical protein [Bacteroidales bacterium]MDK2988336.1 hypothetical protein [Methanothermococcus sp.]
MVKAIVNISDENNQVINIIKAKYNLKDKSEAINKIIEEYAEILLEPELKPDYVEKIKRIMENETPIHIGSVEELNKRYLGE